MKARDVIYREFVEKWTHPDYRPVPLTDAALNEFEDRLGCKLPLAYREFMSQYGPVSATLALSTSIIAGGQKVPDFQEFLSPADALSRTRDWNTLGLPRDRFAIASDSAGNLFCFKFGSFIDRVDDAPVFFFDHDFRSNRRVASSIAGLLDQLATVPKVET